MAYYIVCKDELNHFGVKGMKWGVRREHNSSNHPMTKRQAKKAIKEAKRSYRKKTGKWMTTGKNVDAIDKKVSKQLKNDEELKTIAKNREALQKKLNKSEDKTIEAYRVANTSKDHLIRLQEDKSATREMRRRVQDTYNEQKKTYEALQSKHDKLKNKYEKLDMQYDRRERYIKNKFYNEYKTAVVKDLNITNINQGRKMLEEYGLYNKALRPTLSDRRG